MQKLQRMGDGGAYALEAFYYSPARAGEMQATIRAAEQSNSRNLICPLPSRQGAHYFVYCITVFMLTDPALM